MRARSPLLHIALAAMMLAGMSVAGCDGDRPTVTVFAAASLAGVLQPLGEDYSSEAGVGVRFHYGGSWMLAQQIIRGLPADAFIAAGPGPMDTLEAAALLSPGTRSNLLGNALVLVGPEDGIPIASPGDLLREEVRRVAMADPKLAPAGAYAREAFQGMGLWDGLRSKLVYGQDVRTAMRYVSDATADAAVVYATDLRGAGGVRLLWRFPPDSHAAVRYPVAALADADNPEAAAFLAFLRSDEAAAAFQEHGFTTP